MVEHASLDFGLRMKRLREERGVSLRYIADATKISVNTLEALERGDLSRLPGGIYGRAFVRSYALEVGLDPEQTVRDFLSQCSNNSITAESPHVAELGKPARTWRGGSVVAIAAILVVIGAILFFAIALLE